METSPLLNDESKENKVLVGFKCSPALRMALCEQAGRMGVSLSSHVEAIVSSYKEKDDRLKELSVQVSALKTKLDFYENPFLFQLYNRFRGQVISYYARDGSKATLTISDVTDVYTVIINSFKEDR